MTIRQYCHVENTAQHCRLGLFQDSDFGGDVEDSKSTPGEICCILGSRTIVPVFCVHHTCELKQYCHVGNTVQQCRLGLFQDSDFAGDLDDSKSTSGGTLRVFGSHTFVPISWMCNKQTSVSHSSTESEVISLDAGLRGWVTCS